MTKPNVAVLEGWVTVAQVAERLHLSRQGIHKMICTNVFDTSELRRLGELEKPFYVISVDALQRLVKEREDDLGHSKGL